MLLLLEVKKMTAFGRHELVLQVPKECWPLTPRKPTIVLVELIYGYWDWLCLKRVHYLSGSHHLLRMRTY